MEVEELEFGWSDVDVAFREELRTFLDDELEGSWTEAQRSLGSPENIAFSRTFCAKLAKRDWLTPHWPIEYGGRNASPWQHLILGEELWSRGEPRGPQYMNVNWIGPSIMSFGTDEQKAQFLPPMARGEVIWCQGFSEPDAGSDLASLRTRAKRDGNDYIVSGEKIWTSYASEADHCYLLVRTDPESVGAKGISVLLVDTDTPGMVIRKIGSVTGDHSFHSLVFEDMRVPVEARLGDEHNGWAIVRHSLAFERVGAPRYMRASRILDETVDWVTTSSRTVSDPLLEDVASARADCEAARLMAWLVVDERANGLPPSPNVYMARAAMVRAERSVAAVVAGATGLTALERGSLGDEQLRRSMMAGMAAGTYEVQMNLIARMKLDLPRS